MAADEESFKVLHAPEPAQSGRIQASNQGFEQLRQTLSAPEQRATRIRAILRTERLYVDSRYVRIAYQVRDAKGNVQVDRSGLSVRVTLGKPTTSCGGSAPLSSGCTTINAYSWTCGLPSSASGIGLCSATLSTAWLRNNGRSTPTLDMRYHSVSYATTTTSPLLLYGQPPWMSTLSSTLTEDGMYATMPVGSAQCTNAH